MNRRQREKLFKFVCERRPTYDLTNEERERERFIEIQRVILSFQGCRVAVQLMIQNISVKLQQLIWILVTKLILLNNINAESIKIAEILCDET